MILIRRLAFELLTHPSGNKEDGSISLNVVNMNWLTMVPANVDHDNDGVIDSEDGPC